MFGIDPYLSFVAAILVFQLIPGPGTVAILGATARNGIGAGMVFLFFSLVCYVIYMLAAVAGLAALLSTMPSVFAAMRWAGIAYLCWMGWGLLRQPVNEQVAEQTAPRSPLVYFRQALGVALTNPKVIMFFMAFFPVFAGRSADSGTLAVMMIHVTLISLVYQTGLVLIGNAVARRLGRVPHARRLATRLAGMALVGFGVRLALDER